MMLKLHVDGVPVEVPQGATVLDAARTAGVEIPTLCYLEKVQAIGACRVCLVEVEGGRGLMASCVTPASEGMKVHTNTARVRAARRTVVELLLSEHDGDCPTCVRNEDCELQTLARSLGVREVRYAGEKAKKIIDDSTPALVRDSGKCVLCRRCVAVCGGVQGVGSLFPQNRGFDTIIGPAFAAPLSEAVCVQCGQCAAVCPVGAIVEHDEVQAVWKELDNPAKHVVVQTAPAIRAALGECFDYPPGELVTGKMVTALRRLGFDGVFDTNFTADLTIIEEGTELLSRLKKALVDKEPVALPQFTSCSPGWIKFSEYFYPEFLPNLSTCKSPQQMFGAVAKTYYAKKLGKKPSEITVVSIMPCTAKKFEARRPEMAKGEAERERLFHVIEDPTLGRDEPANEDRRIQDVDYVLTTRELGRMIREAGIDFRSLPDGEMDAPMGLSSGAADIFANTGGVMEAALRTVYALVTGRILPFENLHVTPIQGLEGVKEAAVTLTDVVPDWSFLEGVTVRVAVAHGLGNARSLMDRIKAGHGEYHFVEVMTCPGGCIGGGGQPRFTTDAVRKARIAAINREDEGKALRMSHNNPQITAIYEEFLGKPLGELSHHLLHTRYGARPLV